MSGDEGVRLTREGYARKQQELEEARRMLYEEIPRRIQAAKRQETNLQENQAFFDLQEERGYYERKVEALEHLLSQATVLDADRIHSETVGVGTQLTLRDEETDEELVFDLVDPAEADLEAAKIATTSPLGQALLGQRVGATVTCPAPSGNTVRYTVSGIARSPAE